MLLRGAESCQVALNYRFDTLVFYDYSCKNTRKKVNQLEKMRTSTQIKQEKVDLLIEDLTKV